MDYDLNLAGEQVTVTLPSNLLAQIDAQVGGSFVDREDFLRSAARHYIEYLQSLAAQATDQGVR